MKKNISIILCVLLMCGCVVGCGTTSNGTTPNDATSNHINETGSNDSISATSNKNNKYKIDVSASENIDVSTNISCDGEELIVCLKNNNTYDIGSFDIIAAYYDKDGNELGEDDTMALNFKSGSEFATSLDLPHNDDYEYIIPYQIGLIVAVDEEYQNQAKIPQMYNDKVKMSYKENGEEISITATNNGDADIDTLECAILFIKDNKVIAIDNFDGSLEAGESDTIEIEIPIDWEKSDDEDVLIEYDSVEIVVNRATQYD